jgi:predicted  nucleic acid-binding Zn-ribbon protein
MVLDSRTHAAVQRRVKDSRNASARARREIEALRREVEVLRRRHAADRSEIVRLNVALEALEETLGQG